MKNLHNALLLKRLYQLKELGYKYTSEEPFKENEQNTLELPNSLLALKQQAQNCHLCSLSKNRNHIVFGEGNEQADLMFIGDAPLEIEDNTGKIFLGRGGEMLTAMIEKVIGISRQKVYLTNLLKCHPLVNKAVHEPEYHTCKAYLFKEIELVKPKIIVTLGEQAYHYLTNDTTKLTNIRGTVMVKDNHSIIPTYHPNFLLKNPSLKKDVFEDLKRVKGLLR
ncbi:MAG: Uracil-DNA glycosylase, family 4 [uncultured Sulfurovum sp.]|uniref:Type-4 uracil-DNA glycosylase n=1 Tax=uncultured Sulfurovum sp. TaxID=269237 RepID=A0A6S6SIH0_9BACT|nr:MAG: Uracil-DNA glycosylase, family 4 [uncultured Sulfurovum sp.]